MIHYININDTVDVKRFAGLNICGFSPMKFLWKCFHSALATSVHYLCIAKNKFKNYEIHESLAQ